MVQSVQWPTYGLHNQILAVRLRAAPKDLALLPSVQIASGANTPSHWMGNGGSYPRDKSAMAWIRSHPSSAKVKNKWRYTFIPPFAFMAFIGTTSYFTSSGLNLKAFIGTTSYFTSSGLNLLIQSAIRHRHTTSPMKQQGKFLRCGTPGGTCTWRKACEKSYNTFQRFHSWTVHWYDQY